MTSIMKLAVVAAITLCSSFSVAEDRQYGVSISAPTASGSAPANTNPGNVPYSNGPILPPVGQNCRTEKVCVSVSCTAYDNQGKCTNQKCVVWEERYVCK